MKVIYVCTYYRGNDNGASIKKNIGIAQRICEVIIAQGDLPIAPHLYLPQFLNDDVEGQREKAIRLGLKMLTTCHELWWWAPEGFKSDGMRDEIAFAHECQIPVTFLDWWV